VAHRRGDTVAERIEAEKALRRETGTPVAERGGALVRQMVRHGTSRVRTHVDIDPEAGLSGLHAVLAIRETFADAVDMQIVAFPQSGIARAPGTAALMDAALAEGATHVGGLDPDAIDNDRDGHLSTVFRLAERHGAGIDIHLHEGGAGGLASLADIAARAGALGMGGTVVVSHAFALGEPHDIGPTVRALAAAGVAILTHGPGPAPMPPVTRLVGEGVTVLAGCDNIRDAWSPYGSGDMLERAMVIGYRQGMNASEELALLFDIVAHGNASGLGFGDASLREGAPADLVLVDAPTPQEAVVGRPERLMVVKRGRMVAERPFVQGARCALV